MKPSHRRTAVLAALLAAWILLVPLGGGIHRAAAIADPEQDHAVSSVLMDTVQGGSRPRDSVTLPSNVTTYVGASITVSPSYHGYGTIRRLAVANPALATAKAVNGSRNIQITGKKAGNTSIKVTFSNGSYKTTEVKVAKGSAVPPSSSTPARRSPSVPRIRGWCPSGRWWWLRAA